MTRSFTLIELLVVIIIIGIIVSTLSFNFSPNQLELAADQIIKDIRLTQSLALKDDKYQPFPNHICDNTIEGKIECNRSKYWFKQWWQIRFSTYNKNGVTYYWYEIFSDQPYKTQRQNFDGTAHLPKVDWDISIAKDPLTKKYLIGECDENGTDFPICNKIDNNLNLTKTFGIKKIEYQNISPRHDILFDNFGNVFVRGSNYKDKGDINPLDKDKRELLTKTAKIILCNKIKNNKCLKDKKHCIAIEISPTGSLEKTTCNIIGKQ